MKYYKQKNIDPRDIQSVETTETFADGFTKLTDTAIDGLWEVEGVYEDVE